jgi:hypothetical protein
VSKISVEFDKDDAEFLVWLLDLYYDEDDDEGTLKRVDRIIANILAKMKENISNA